MDGDALLLLSRLLHATHPEVRAAAVFALSICIQVPAHPLGLPLSAAAATVQVCILQHLSSHEFRRQCNLACERHLQGLSCIDLCRLASQILHGMEAARQQGLEPKPE